jgi:hypothetical protein
MSKPIDGTDLSSGHQPNKNTNALTAAKSNISQNNLKTAQANSAGEFIYNTMIPQSAPEPAEVPLSSASPAKQLGRRQMSMDLKLKSDDFHLEGDTTAAEDGGVQLSNAKPCHVTSSDFVQSYILDGEEEPLKLAPSRPANIERISTGDSILKENLARMTSSDWKIEEDFRDESSVAMKDLLEKTPRPCMGTVCAALQRLSTADMDVEDGSISNIRMASDVSSDWVQDFKGQQSSDMVPIRPSLFDEKAASERKLVAKKPLPYTDQLVPTPDAATSNDVSQEIKSSSSEKKTKKKKKKKRERVIDEGHVCIPTDDDVLFGRGGYTNSHPGNIRFRAKALEFRPMYEQSTKEEKYQISQLLLESVMNEGARFLEKGKDDQWHQVIGNGARKKASQALRERIKGTPRRSTKLSSSLKSSTRSQSPKFEAPPGMTDDILPAEVDELVPV